jgi:hypothetical protein
MIPPVVVAVRQNNSDMCCAAVALRCSFSISRCNILVILGIAASAPHPPPPYPRHLGRRSIYAAPPTCSPFALHASACPSWRALLRRAHTSHVRSLAPSAHVALARALSLCSLHRRCLRCALLRCVHVLARALLSCVLTAPSLCAVARAHCTVLYALIACTHSMHS